MTEHIFKSTCEMLKQIYEVCCSVFKCYMQAVRSVDTHCPADQTIRKWAWNPDWNPFWSPLVMNLRDIHSEIAYFMTLFNTSPFKLVWCFYRIPRNEHVRLCGIRETIRQGAEEEASASSIARDKDLRNVNDAIEAMICIQQALHRFEAHDGLRLGLPRLPERCWSHCELFSVLVEWPLKMTNIFSPSRHSPVDRQSWT